MQWNWQHKDWPYFTYQKEALSPLESAFLHQSGILIGACKYMNDEEKTVLVVDVLADEALKTSEIEGEYLNRDSVQAFLRRQFHLEMDQRKIPAAEQGVSQMMVDLYQHFAASLTHETLYAWHSMLMQGRRDIQVMGGYRTHPEPMEVISGPLHKPIIHFEAPPSERMLEEMTRFITWFNDTAPDGPTPLPALTRAGIAHLYFVSIHPFEDGNGRIGRTVAEKVLSQALKEPALIMLSHVIEQEKKRYYDMLERSNKSNEITAWLTYFAEVMLKAQKATLALVEFMIEKTKLYYRVRGQLNARQEKVIARMFREGPGGFKGGLSAEKYISITGASRATATRDLQDLVELGVLLRKGERKSTRYLLNVRSA